MAFLGFVSERECQRWEGAPPYIPAFSFHEKHQSAPINATPEAIIQAVLALDMAEDPIQSVTDAASVTHEAAPMVH